MYKPDLKNAVKFKDDYKMIPVCREIFSDFITPIKALKKLMNESIPLGERDFIPIIADEKGIVWAERFGIADRVKPDTDTKRYMIIEVKEK